MGVACVKIQTEESLPEAPVETPAPTPEPTPVVVTKPSSSINTTITLEVEDDEEVEGDWKNLGAYTLTAYCPCVKCSEGYGNSTATGATATAGRTIAVDPKVIPYGAKVKINGHVYVAEDCGGAIKNKKIDIYFDTHKEASNFGRRKAEVFLYVGE